MNDPESFSFKPEDLLDPTNLMSPLNPASPLYESLYGSGDNSTQAKEQAKTQPEAKAELKAELKALKCPSCGGDIDGPGKCEYCGSRIVKGEDSQLKVSEENAETENTKEFSMDDHNAFVKKRAKGWEIALNSVGILATLAAAGLVLNDIIGVVPMSQIETSFGVVGAGLLMLPTLFYNFFKTADELQGSSKNTGRGGK